MDVLKLILAGIYSIADSCAEPRDYVRSDRKGTERDNLALANDVRAVGGDMKRTIQGYGEQTYQRASSKSARRARIYSANIHR